MEPKTPGQFILWAEQCFEEAELCFGHGTDNARDEAAFLVLRALQLPFETDAAVLHLDLDEAQRRHIAQLVRQRIEQRQPLAYLLNEAWFCGLPFYVDQRVLVPRSPVAELIYDRFSPWVATGKVERILDIGTGSGCIAIAAALAFPDSSVDAIDISADALLVAAENCRRHGVSERVRLLRSDLFDRLEGQRYDIIVANPPYVGAEELAGLPPEYRHEPALALQASDNGLAIVRRLLAGSRAHLNDEGILVVEVGNRQRALVKAYPALEFLWLEFENGGHGVFLLEAAQLDKL